MYYSLVKYKQKGYYDIIKYISENVTLFQIMDSLVNVNHAISIVWYCIFDSNYKKALILHRSSLDMIFFPSVVEEQAAKFETVFSSVIYICSAAQLKKE